MRITLTIDADIAAAIQRLRKQRDASLKEVVNEALRRGLKELAPRKAPRKHFRTRTVSLGRPKIDSLDNISDALTFAEGAKRGSS